MGDVLGREIRRSKPSSFGSGESGVPGFVDPPLAFTVEPGKTKLNPGLDGAIAADATGRAPRGHSASRPWDTAAPALYTPEESGKRRFVVSPNALLVYDVEVLANQAGTTGLLACRFGLNWWKPNWTTRSPKLNWSSGGRPD